MGTLYLSYHLYSGGMMRNRKDWRPVKFFEDWIWFLKSMARQRCTRSVRADSSCGIRRLLETSVISSMPRHKMAMKSSNTRNIMPSCNHSPRLKPGLSSFSLKTECLSNIPTSIDKGGWCKSPPGGLHDTQIWAIGFRMAPCHSFPIWLARSPRSLTSKPAFFQASAFPSHLPFTLKCELWEPHGRHGHFLTLPCGLLFPVPCVFRTVAFHESEEGEQRPAVPNPCSLLTLQGADMERGLWRTGHPGYCPSVFSSPRVQHF